MSGTGKFSVGVAVVGLGLVFLFWASMASAQTITLAGTDLTITDSNFSGLSVIQNGDGTSIPSAATLTINNTGAITFSGTVSDSPVVGLGTLDYTKNFLDEVPTGQATYAGCLSLVKSGGGLLSLSGNAILYNGNTTVSAGTLQLVNAVNWADQWAWTGQIPGVTVTIAAGAVLDYHLDAPTPISKVDNVDAGLFWTNPQSTLTGSGTFVKSGSGILTIGGYGSPSIALNVGGVIDVEGGSLRVYTQNWGGADWSHNNASLNVGANGFVDLVGDGGDTFVIVDALTGSGTVSSTYNGGSLTIGVAGGSGTFSGVIADGGGGTLSLTKAGTGTEWLTGTNRYSGGTTVSGGTLVVNGSVIGGGPVTVSNAALVVKGSFVGNGAVSVANGTLAVDGSMSPFSVLALSGGTLSGTGSVGNVVDSSYAVIQPGDGGAGTLTANGLALANGDTLLLTLNTPRVAPGTGGNSLIRVSTQLGLDVGVTVDISSSKTLANGVYYLASFASAVDNSSGFNSWSATGAGARYSFVLAGHTLDLVVGSWTMSGAACTWSGTGGGSWATPGHWSGGVPSHEGDTATFGGSISAAATVNLDGARTLSGLDFNNSNSYTLSASSGDVTSTLTLANSGLPVTVNVASGSHTIAVPLILADDATITPASSATLTISGPISETGGSRTVILNGAGTLVLASGNNAYTGGTQIRAGTLQLNDPNAVQHSTVAVGSANGLAFATGIGTFSLGGLAGGGSFALADTAGNVINLQIGGDNQSTLFNGSLSGSGNLTKAGTGVLALAGSGVQYLGNTTVTGGTLQLVDAIDFSSSVNPSSVANTINIGPNGVIEFNVSDNTGWSNDGGNQALGANGGTTITGNGVFLKTGPGVLGLDENGGGHPVYMNMSGGTIDVEDGTLKNGGWKGGVWSNNYASMTIGANGAFDLWDGNMVKVDALNGSGAITCGNGNSGNGLTVGINNGSGAFSGTINIGSDFDKAGTGTEVLSGSVSTSGNVNINAGVLKISGTLGSNTVNVNGTGTLTGTGTITGSIHVYAGGTLAPGDGSLKAQSNVTLDAGSALTYTLGSGNDSLLAVSGTLTINPNITLNVSAGTGWGNGTYLLTSGASGLNDDSNSFNGWHVSGSSLGSHYFTVAENGNDLDLVVAANGGSVAAWNRSTSGVWGTAGNWTPNVVPANPGDTANFPAGVAGANAVTVTIAAASVSVGSLTFNTTGGGSYTIAGSGLILDNGLGWATLTNSGGNQTISAPVTVKSWLQLSIASGSTLTISGALNGDSDLTIGGGGTLILSDAGSYTGPMALTAGTLQVPGGNFGAPVTMSNNANVTVVGGGTLSSPISGVGSLTKVGDGVLNVTGVNAYSGVTAVTQGTLRLTTAPLMTTPVVSYSFDGSLGTLSTVGISDSNWGGTWSTTGTFADTSGHGNTISVFTWGGVVSVVPGKYGQAASLPGGGVRLQTAAPLAGPVLTSWTDSVWVNLSAATLASRNSYLMTGRLLLGGDSYGFDTWINSSGITVEIPGTNNSNGGHGWDDSQGSTAVSVSPNTWTMITQTVTTGVYKLYVNGALVDTQTMNPNYTPFFAEAGASLSLGVNDLSGELDNFNLYNTVLTAAQVKSLYMSTIPDGYGALSPTSNVQLAAGTTLDLGGISQTAAGLDDSGAGAIVTNSTANPVTFTLAPAGTSRFTGVIEDGAAGGQTSLTVSGPGTQILTGSNTYSGPTTITGGTLQLGNGGTTGSIDGTSAVVDNGALVFNRLDNIVFAPAISGSGGVVQMGPGALVFPSKATYAGPTMINGGTLQAAAPGATVGLIAHYSFSGTGAIPGWQPFTDLTGNGYTLYAYNGNSSYVPGATGHFANGVSMSGNLLYTGPGSDGGGPTTKALPTLTTWTDSIWFNLPPSAVSNSGTQTPLFSTTWKGPGGTATALEYFAVGTWDHLSFNAGFATWLGDASGNSCMDDWGPGRAVQVTVTPDTWNMVTQTIKGTTYSLYLNAQLLGSYQLNSVPTFAVPQADLTLGYAYGNWKEPQSLGDFSLYGTALSAAQIAQLYSEGIAGLEGTLPNTTSVTLARAATLDLVGARQTVLSLSDGTGGGGTVTNSGTATGTIVFAPTSGSTTFSGSINDGTGPVAVVMSGTGTQVLSGHNNYTGDTNISGGVLMVHGSLNSSGNVVVNAGVLSGRGSVGNVTVNSGATLAPGLLGSGTLTAASVTVNSGSILDYTLGTGNGADGLLAITGSLTLSSSVTVNVTPGTAFSLGTYVLATASLGIVDSSNSFAGWTATGLGGDTYRFSDSSGNSLDLIVGSVGSVAGAWNASTGGSWAAPGNWLNNATPTNAGDTATFGDSIGSNPVAVNLDGNRTLSSLAFNTTLGGSYTISRSSGDTSVLTLDNGAAAATVSNSGGSHTIAVPVALNSNMAVSATTGSSLTISGPISENSPGKVVSLIGGGNLTLSGTNTYTGGTKVTSGTLVFAKPDALPKTGILNVGRTGTADLTSLLAASSPAAEDGGRATGTTTVASEPATTSVATADEGTGSATPVTNGLAVSSAGVTVGRAAAVPEPSTFVLLGVAAIGLLGYVWRRKRAG